ncbi:ABC transporter permease [Sporosarcina cyprini]|uniref:ABC transporter permease n=1 Tax=Sporosarcina cyprini TaxID=2910523 RepID=UPI001EDCE6C7|nr:ABC transporter permease [Sporosarcina cyprini]MCG3087302.1 ABC transporter permease [Sporosarcina cyprini]
MEAVQRFFRHSVLSYKALFGWLDPKVYVFVMVLNPFSQLLFFAVLVNYVYGGEGLAGYIASNALLLCVMNSVFGMMSVITSDRVMGTLQLVMSTPSSKAPLFISRSLAHVVNGVFTAVMGLLFGILLFGLSIPLDALFSLLVIWLVSIFSACGLGLIIATFCLWSPSMHLWSNLLASLLLLVSGANYPLSVMPAWLEQIAAFVPLTRGVRLTKDIVNQGDFSHVTALLSQEFLLGCFFFAISLVLIAYAEYLARVKGTMDLE